MYNANSLFLSTAGGYNISRSLRFNDNDSAHLDRTPSSSGNRRTFTFSCWCKRSNIGSFASLFSSSDGSDFFKFQFRDDNRFEINTADGGSDTTQLITTARFRDVSAWYHIVIAFDTTQGDASNRVKMYVNNRQITSFDNTTRPSQNQQHAVNHNIEHQIGNQVGTSRYFDGYMAEINHVDGQQLEPSSFGEYHPITGAWVPRSYSGSHGTNGFYLNFSDNSNNTAATLGKDSSGSNNFTPNNFSVSAGQGNDSLEDTPTNNWCTLNPIYTSDVSTYSNGNLDVVCNNASTAGGTIAVKSGKWYAEVVCTAKTASNAMIGVCTVDGFDGDRQLDESQNGGSGTGYVMNGTKLSGGASYGATWAVDDVMGIALDLDSAQNTVTFYKNGSSQGAINIDNAYYVFCSSNGQGSSTVDYRWNFGQRAFSYSIPSGHLELNTKNLPTPIIADGRKHFNTALFDGNGSTQSVTGVGFKPDWVWFRMRTDSSRGNAQYDSSRGGSVRLDSTSTMADRSGEGAITFDSDGFSITQSHPATNDSGDSVVAWNWKANGGTTSTNTDGTITSTVQANVNAGFSIVLYSGAGETANVGHGLGVPPKTIFIKGRTNTDQWFVYNKNLSNPTTGYLYWNLGNTETTGANPWGGNAADSSVFTVVNDGGVGSSGNDYVAYCFAEVEGYSKFGRYDGNGSTDGPYIHLGFKPAFVMTKRYDSSDFWLVADNKRDAAEMNPNDAFLKAETQVEEGNLNISGGFDFLSSGFKIRHNDGAVNGTNDDYLYFAFAETPFKYTTAR
jgi:hypothetical protein